VLFNKDQTILIQCPGGKSGAYTVPESVTYIDDYTFQNCSSLTSITIPDSVTEIGYGAFQYCRGLKSIGIPDGVTSFGAFAFQDCSSLTSVIIGNGVTSIGKMAFYNCTGLTSINIPESVTEIGEEAFQNCRGLKSIEIPNSVTSIGDSAFSGCGSLTSIVIPDSVTEIGYGAFSYCTGLTGVYFKGNAPTMGYDVFYGCDALETIYYMEGNTGWTNPWYGLPTALCKSPEITEDPQSQAAIGGAPVILSVDVDAESTEPLKYQWYKDGTLLEGATGTSYTISSLSAGDLGSYTVVVSNILGDVTSSPAEITVIQVSPVITWANPAAITYGTALSAAQLNATADVEGSFDYKPSAGTILDAGTHKLSLKFTPTDTLNYTSASKSVEIVVNKATPVIKWATPAAITYGTPLSATQLNATADVEGSLAYTQAAGTILDAGTQT
jgi:hypothetical protein